MPRDWNNAYENDDTPWDKGYAAPPLTEFLELLSGGKVGRSSLTAIAPGRRRFHASRRIDGQVLVPGCGTGHDVRLLAAQGAEVVGLDIAPGALKKAGDFPTISGETYELGNFLELDRKYSGSFDWVVEHTCLCAIEPSEREAYVKSLKLALKSDGQFLAVFFREVSNYTGDGPPHPISAEEIEQLFGQDFEVIESYVPQQIYPSRPAGGEEVCWMRKRDG